MGNLVEIAELNSEELAAVSSPVLRAALERRLHHADKRGGFNSFIGPAE